MEEEEGLKEANMGTVFGICLRVADSDTVSLSFSLSTEETCRYVGTE